MMNVDRIATSMHVFANPIFILWRCILRIIALRRPLIFACFRFYNDSFLLVRFNFFYLFIIKKFIFFFSTNINRIVFSISKKTKIELYFKNSADLPVVINPNPYNKEKQVQSLKVKPNPTTKGKNWNMPAARASPNPLTSL